MFHSVSKKLIEVVSRWLTKEREPPGRPLSDFDRLREEVQLADVLLVEGRARVSEIIQIITLSSWSHAALYVGRLGDLPEPYATSLAEQRGWGSDQQLIVEAEMGLGTVISPLEKYADYHLRICRPKGLLDEDRKRVVRFALNHLGTPYNLRQILDLLRFFFPYGLLPKRWRSSLFEVRHGQLARMVCSTLIGEAFASVRFPIRPQVQLDDQGGYIFHRSNSRLFAPRDFDYSPYFDIIKYPFLGGQDVHIYKEMYWDDQGVIGEGELGDRSEVREISESEAIHKETTNQSEQKK